MSLQEQVAYLRHVLKKYDEHKHQILCTDQIPVWTAHEKRRVWTADEERRKLEEMQRLKRREDLQRLKLEHEDLQRLKLEHASLEKRRKLEEMPEVADGSGASSSMCD